MTQWPRKPPAPVIPETDITNKLPRAALYRLYDKHGALLYIGITTNLGQRFTQHRATKPWWGSVTRKTAAWYGSKQEAWLAEDAAICAEDPIHNRAEVTRPRVTG